MASQLPSLKGVMLEMEVQSLRREVLRLRRQHVSDVKLLNITVTINQQLRDELRDFKEHP